MNYRDIVVSAECQLRFWCNLFILAFILLFIALTYYEKKVVAHPTEIQVCLSMIFAARRQPLGSAERLVFATQSSLICLSVCVCVCVCLSVCLSAQMKIMGFLCFLLKGEFLCLLLVFFIPPLSLPPLIFNLTLS